MSKEFQQISLKPGFMKHNGGVMFRNISDIEYEFKSTISENHLNAAGITHGGYLSALIDAGAGTAAHRAAERALPLLQPGNSLRFIFLPSGEDPDTLIKSVGRDGMEEILSNSSTLSQVIWNMESVCTNRILY